MMMKFPSRNKNRRSYVLLFSGLALLIGGVLIFFPSKFSTALYAAGRPVWFAESLIASPFGNFFALLQSKQTLLDRTIALMKENAELKTKVQDRDLLKTENETLRELFSRKPEKQQFILASILARPGFFSYDSFVLDVGSEEGVAIGQTVYASEYLPIGTISNVGSGISTVTLFSNPGMETPVVIGEGTTTPGTALGKGGGNFEIKLPRSVSIKEGDVVRFAARSDVVFGTIRAIVTNPTDSFEQAIFTLPVNIQQISTVLIEKKS